MRRRLLRISALLLASAVAPGRAAVIENFAGTGARGFSGDGGPAAEARLNGPSGLQRGPDGALYVCDTGNNRIRRIDPNGTISTFAGTGERGWSGDGGPAAAARLNELAYVSQIGEVTRPRAGGKGVQLQVGTAVWELLEPTGDGPLADYLGRYGQRIRSTVFRTGNLSEVDKHLTGQGFDLVPGDADGALVINPAQNKNLLFEFTE